jgi:hypothetical protein
LTNTPNNAKLNKPKQERGYTMARTLSVKIPTSTLIADIEKTIAQIDADVANYAEATKEYREAVKTYEAEVMAKAKEALSNPANIGTDGSSPVRLVSSYRYNSISVEFDTEALGFPEKPTEPVRPNQRESFGREYTTRKDILERNLRILKMTTQEEVSASSYSAVIDLI